MDFIRADRNPASLGVAGAGYASFSSGTAFSAFANPALVPLSTQKLHAAGVFGLLPSGDSNGMAYGGGAAMKFGKFGLSAGFIGSSYPTVPLSSEGGGASGSFTPNDMQAALGLSFGIGENLAIGAVARYANQALDNKTSLNGFCADIMAVYRLDALNLSAGVVGLGPKVKSVSNRSYPLPASAKIAAAYTLGFGDFSAEVAADADYYFSGNFSAAAGAQVGFRDMVFLRTGYRYSGAKADFTVAPVPSFFSLGLGAKLYGVNIDAAFLMGSGATGTLALSLGYSF